MTRSFTFLPVFTCASAVGLAGPFSALASLCLGSIGTESYIFKDWRRRYVLVITALERLMREDRELKTNMGYTVNLRPTWAI